MLYGYAGVVLHGTLMTLALALLAVLGATALGISGALEEIPGGQVEAALSVGMKSSQVFRKVTLPQVIRYALPGYSNNIQVIIKATALVSIIGLVDIITVTQQAGQATQHAFFFNLLAAAIYLALTSVVMWFLFRLNRHANRGVKRAAL